MTSAAVHSATTARRLTAVAISLWLSLAGTGTAQAAGIQLAAEPGSLHRALLYHLDFATDVDGTPIDEGDTFQAGIPRVLTLLGWDHVPSGTSLRLRIYADSRLVYDDTRPVTREDDGGFVFDLEPSGGVPAGAYVAQLDYNGVPDEIATFAVIPAGAAPGPGTTTPTPAGRSSLTGPVPYANPADVLVVTRASVLRRTLGARADAVLAAAAKVGTLRDLEADGVKRATPDAAIEEVHRLLRAGRYRYLLILGNDDAVPYAHMANPVAADERDVLDSWDLPADWVPSDDPYTDLDGDQWTIPDIAIARIPSSDDADLLLTQLGVNIPTDNGGFALINQKRRGVAEPVLETMAGAMDLDRHYTPPTTPASIPATSRAARYTYILLHGIGVTTDSWVSDLVAWSPEDIKNLDGSWIVKAGGQVDAIGVAQAGVAGGIVDVGACYGGWTLDTIQAPTHKTAANDLALDYLRSGTRAYVADTHISYSAPIGLDGVPVARTGFELLFWRAVVAGASPIDAFQAAKVGLGRALDAAVAAGDSDAAALDYKTIEIMGYLGRP